MAVSASGVGSGIDINSLVSQLVAAERDGPESLLKDKELSLDSQLSAIGILKSQASSLQDSLATLTDPGKFIIYSTTSSDESVLTASSDDTAQPGSFGITVTQLATAYKSSTASFADATSTEVGTGNVTIANAKGDSFTLNFVGGGDNTLVEIQNAINSDADNFGVTASIINIDDGGGGTVSKLILTSDETGEDNALTLTADASLSALDSANLAPLETARNAIIQIDDAGNTFTSQSNTITGAINGVTIEAKTLGSSTIAIAQDQDAIIESIDEFITAYNALQAELNYLAGYNDGDPGPLFSDSTTRGIRSQIEGIIGDTVSSISNNYNNLAVLGITTNDNGELELNETELKAALNDNVDAVSNVFTATDGITTRINDVLEEYTKYAGLLDNKRDSINARLDDIDDAREQLEYRIGKLEARLMSQFIAMDSLVATLSSTGTFLTEQLSSLPGVTKPS